MIEITVSPRLAVGLKEEIVAALKAAYNDGYNDAAMDQPHAQDYGVEDWEVWESYFPKVPTMGNI